MIASIPVGEAMTSPVQTIDPDETADAVARELRGGDIGSLVVVDAEDRPTGIVTETDLVTLLADGRDPSTVRVDSFMSSPVVSVESGIDVVQAAERAREADVDRVAVVEDGRLVGILTTTDLLYYLPDVIREWSPPERPRTGLDDVRTETAYEREDWEFVYDAAAPDTVDVGDVASFTKTLTDEDARSFAETTGDTNRLHLDDEFAADTRFGRRIVHGALVTGLISATLARLPGLTIYVAEDFQFLGPVDVGDRVTAVCEVVEHLGDSKYQLSVTVRDEDDEAVVTGSATVLIDALPGIED